MGDRDDVSSLQEKSRDVLGLLKASISYCFTLVYENSQYCHIVDWPHDKVFSRGYKVLSLQNSKHS